MLLTIRIAVNENLHRYITIFIKPFTSYVIPKFILLQILSFIAQNLEMCINDGNKTHQLS